MFLLSIMLLTATASAQELTDDGQNTTGRIVGGEETTIEEHPHQVDLLVCGGCIIGKKWVLSAAHCGDTFKIYVGSKYFSEGQEINVKKNIIHPKYGIPLSYSHDFMLLELAEELVFGPTINAIPLGDASDIVDEASAVITGWGVTSESADQSEILRKVTVNLVSDEQCAHAYNPKNLFDPESMVCAMAPGKDSCAGDSGGPLSVNGKLIGITSFGEGCARPEYPGVYARVPAVRDWIKNVTGI